MNNVVIGSSSWTYYETLGGGQGASQPARRAVRRPRRHVEHAEHADRGARARAAAARRALRAARRLRRQADAHRGGDGLVREIRVLEPATLSLLTDRRRHAPQGLDGRRARPAGPEPPERRRAAAEGDARARARRRRHGRDTGRRRVGKNRAMSRWVGQPIPRREDLPLLTGPRAVRRRRPGREPAPRRLRALAVGARRDPLGRPLRGARRARGRSRRSPAPSCPDLTDPFAAGITHGWLLRDGRRPRPLRGRAGRGGRGRVALSRRGRRRARRRRLRAARRRGHRRGRARPDEAGRCTSRSARTSSSTARFATATPTRAFARADLVVTETLRWERYSSTPIETYGDRRRLRARVRAR